MCLNVEIITTFSLYDKKLTFLISARITTQFLKFVYKYIITIVKNYTICKSIINHGYDGYHLFDNR